MMSNHKIAETARLTHEIKPGDSVTHHINHGTPNIATVTLKVQRYKDDKVAWDIAITGSDDTGEAVAMYKAVDDAMKKEHRDYYPELFASNVWNELKEEMSALLDQPFVGEEGVGFITMDDYRILVDNLVEKLS